MTSSQAQPLVSAIIPAYNCAPFIGEAIESVLGQDYPNLETIVVDDGSTDGTAEVVRAFGPRVLLVQQENRGPAAARNTGVAHSRGELLAFLDGDDVWLPGKLAAQVEHLRRHPEVGVVHARFSQWYPDSAGRFSPPPKTPPATPDDVDQEGSGWIYSRLLMDSLVCIITTVVRRSLFVELGGFDESFSTGEDYDLWLRASRQTQFHKLGAEGALYRMLSTSATKAPRSTPNEYRALMKSLNQFGASGPDGAGVQRNALDARLARLCFEHGYLHFWRGDACVAAEAFRTALKHQGLHLRTATYAALSWVRCVTRSQYRNAKVKSS